MTDDRYQRAKELFNELLELSAEEQAKRLAQLKNHSPELAEEVRSLLSYHTAQSLIAPPSTPKIRTRSTLSTTYHTRSLRWMEGPLKGLAGAAPLFLLGLVIAFWANSLIYNKVKTAVAERLNESIDYRVREFRLWEQQELRRAMSWGQHPDILNEVDRLVESIRSLSPEDPNLPSKLRESSCCRALADRLALLAERPVKFAVWDRRMLTLVDWNQLSQPELLGKPATTTGTRMLAPVLKGNAKLFLPNSSVVITEGFRLEQISAPTLSILIPIASSNSDSVIAAMMVRGYGLEEQYADMLQRWSNSSGGEMYLLSDRGALLSNSRYSERLADLPLALDQTGSKNKKRPLVRDPGVDLLKGQTPAEPSAAWLPTLLARQVAAGDNGVFVDGYRNYVGQKVVGAWRWLPDHEVGVGLEESYDEAFSIATTTRNGILGLTGLFSLALVGFALAAAWNDRSRRLHSLSEVGPYQIQELLGEGGMGRVYLAEHALLCRQSAIKVLTKGENDLSVISRFEREVQLASQLTHPNTIAIYDFGRSRDGVFYYAMEYINGAHLGQLVEYTGPLEPGRAIYILRQLCRALFEAHHAGVVHRDIKPQNIMVCNRGGEPDFVKLFDYGLVKAFAPGVSHNPSQTKVVVGTPRFMAPERLNSPWLADPRVDVYSVGALAYYLLTAQLPPLVTVGDPIEHEQPGVETLDLPPAVVEFGGILSVCMSVEPASRPSNMVSLLRELDSLAKKFPWTREDSEHWWSKHEEKLLRLVRTKRKLLKPDDAKSLRM